MSDMNSQPLVSVPVLTYNSSRFIIETLESIKAQTYPNIELIVSDDCSSDNTVMLCKNWIAENSGRFVRAIVLEAAKNTGVAANGNRGEIACKGEWIKGIAGDDIMMPNCIFDYIEFIQTTPNVIYAFSKIETFGEDKIQNERFLKVFQKYDFFNLSAKEQHRYLIFNNCIPAATLFYNKAKSKKLKITNDERIPLLEDWPKWINITQKNVKLNLLDKITIKYRIRSDSLSVAIPNDRSIKTMALFYKYYQFPFHFKEHPRLAIIKYIKAMQFTTKEHRWYYLEKILRIPDTLYCKLKDRTIDDDDWENTKFV